LLFRGWKAPLSQPRAWRVPTALVTLSKWTNYRLIPRLRFDVWGANTNIRKEITPDAGGE